MDPEPEMRFDSWHTNDLAWLLDELTIEPAGAISEDTQERIVRAARAELERRRGPHPN
ncbi:hypothetical protein [Prescottella equi]|uniref:hypothetical protein n=1 Tax=Rhodococcus hoagii TaxID=43767 RepID=UPI00131BC172|nr:hypothetical protein [Prescottella equi]